jgi:hypothetical protein
MIGLAIPLRTSFLYVFIPFLSYISCNLFFTTVRLEEIEKDERYMEIWRGS